jgi:hypothetical protein
LHRHASASRVLPLPPVLVMVASACSRRCATVRGRSFGSRAGRRGRAAGYGSAFPGVRRQSGPRARVG